MGVTRLETDRAVFYFGHEIHSNPFRLKVSPDDVDVLVVEPKMNLPQDSLKHITVSDAFSNNFINSSQAFEFAKANGKDVWVADGVENERYLATVMLAEMAVGATIAYAGLGKLDDHKGPNPITRRQSMIRMAAGLGLTASGLTILVHDLNRYLPLITNYHISKEVDDIARDGELPLDDKSRSKVSYYTETGHLMMLRNAIVASKVNWLAEHLRGIGIEKPRIYMVYGAAHTRILDYLNDPMLLEESLTRWRTKRMRYYGNEWLNAVTRWRHDAEKGWQTEVHKPKIRGLEAAEQLPVETIEPTQQVSRREMLGKLRRI